MALFFFVAGFFYKDKNTNNVFLYIGKKMMGLWLPMIKYIVAFILLHNIFLKLNIYSTIQNEHMIYPTVYYSVIDTLTYCFNTIFQGNYPVEMAGAMWFVLPLIVSMSMFCLISHSAIVLNFKDKKKYIWISVIIVIFAIIGFYFSYKSWKFAWRVDIALFSLPIIYFGYLYNKTDTNKSNWYLIIIAIAIIIFFYKREYMISYVEAKLGNPIKFILVSLSGIYLNLAVAKSLNKIKYINKAIALVGRESFNIMALHFLSFKFVNLLDVIISNKPIYYIAKYPYSNEKLWLVYLLAGLIIPILYIKVYRYIKIIIVNKVHEIKNT